MTGTLRKLASLLSLSCLGLMVSCVMVDLSMPMSDQALVFETADKFGNPFTKTGSEGGQFADGSVIGVHADYVTRAGSHEFMYNEDVRKTSSGWTYSPVKYWPSEGELKFYAYYPHVEELNDRTVAEHAGDGRLIPYLNGKHDIAWARQFNDKDTGTGLTYAEDGPAVSMNFAHKLSQFRFRFNKTPEFKLQGDYHVTELAINGAFPWAAFLDVETGEWVYEGTDAYYDNLNIEEPTSFLNYTGEFPIVEPSLTNPTETIVYLMGAGMNSFDLVLTTDYGDPTVPGSTSRTLGVTISLGEALQEGGSYVINLNFGVNMTIVDLSFEVAEWKDVDPYSDEVGDDYLADLICRWDVKEWVEYASKESIGIEYIRNLHLDWIAQGWKDYALDNLIGADDIDSPLFNWFIKNWDSYSNGSENLGDGSIQNIIFNWITGDWTKYESGDTMGGSSLEKLLLSWITGDWTNHNNSENMGEDQEGSLTGQWIVIDWTPLIYEEIMGGDQAGSLDGGWTTDPWTDHENEGSIVNNYGQTDGSYVVGGWDDHIYSDTFGDEIVEGGGTDGDGGTTEGEEEGTPEEGDGNNEENTGDITE